jgi:glycine/D-amino acid oxidase-like deaminating enzyme
MLGVESPDIPTESAASMRMPIERRAFLKTAGLATLGVAAAPGCARQALDYEIVQPRRKFARVIVSPERVVRVVVGLRPYRRAGFVVRTEQIDDKAVIHNYGHGGRGVSLSWGTGGLAIEEALRTVHRRSAVIGCGVVGLATARLLQAHGFEVTLYARDLPPNTTSNVALAMWDESRAPSGAAPALREQYRRANRFSYEYFQGLVGDRMGVQWLPNYSALENASDGLSSEAPGEFFPGYEVLAEGEHPFGSRTVASWRKMLIEPPVYLEALRRDFLLAGGRIVVREFEDIASLVALPEPLMVNCTGLGARALFGDEELVPAKGQLVVLLPQPEVDYITDISGDMCPRRDGILLGSTWERGVWSTEPNESAVRRVLASQAALFDRMG